MRAALLLQLRYSVPHAAHRGSTRNRVLKHRGSIPQGGPHSAKTTSTTPAHPSMPACILQQVRASLCFTAWQPSALDQHGRY